MNAYKLCMIAVILVCILSLVAAIYGHPNTMILCMVWAVFFEVRSIKCLIKIYLEGEKDANTVERP